MPVYQFRGHCDTLYQQLYYLKWFSPCFCPADSAPQIPLSRECYPFHRQSSVSRGSLHLPWVRVRRGTVRSNWYKTLSRFRTMSNEIYPQETAAFFFKFQNRILECLETVVTAGSCSSLMDWYVFFLSTINPNQVINNHKNKVQWGSQNISIFQIKKIVSWNNASIQMHFTNQSINQVLF